MGSNSTNKTSNMATPKQKPRRTRKWDKETSKKQEEEQKKEQTAENHWEELYGALRDKKLTTARQRYWWMIIVTLCSGATAERIHIPAESQFTKATLDRDMEKLRNKRHGSNSDSLTTGISNIKIQNTPSKN